MNNARRAVQEGETPHGLAEFDASTRKKHFHPLTGLGRYAILYPVILPRRKRFMTIMRAAYLYYYCFTGFSGRACRRM